MWIRLFMFSSWILCCFCKQESTVGIDDDGLLGGNLGWKVGKFYFYAGLSSAMLIETTICVCVCARHCLIQTRRWWRCSLSFTIWVTCRLTVKPFFVREHYTCLSRAVPVTIQTLWFICATSFICGLFLSCNCYCCIHWHLLFSLISWLLPLFIVARYLLNN